MRFTRAENKITCTGFVPILTLIFVAKTFYVLRHVEKGKMSDKMIIVIMSKMNKTIFNNQEDITIKKS